MGQRPAPPAAPYRRPAAGTAQPAGVNILALTDLHGATEIGAAILKTGVAFDVVALAGDLTRFFTPRQAEPAVAPFVETGQPVLAVAGNCDGPETLRLLEQIGCSVAGRGVIVNGVGFCGVPSSPPHHGQTWELAEPELASWLELGHRDIAAADTKVLVSHAPPVGTRMPGRGGGSPDNGREAQGDGGTPVPGSTAVRDGALRYGFDLVLCGHIHEARGATRLDDKVTVVNPGPARAGHYAMIAVHRDRIAVHLLTLGRAAGDELIFPLTGRQ